MKEYQAWPLADTLKAIQLRLDGWECREIDRKLGKREGSTRSKFRRLTMTGVWDGTSTSLSHAREAEERKVNEWTREEDAILRREFISGTTIANIAKMLPGRTEAAISTRAQKRGLVREQPVNNPVPWLAGPRFTESATCGRCPVSVTADTPEVARAFTARLVASVGLMRSMRGAV